MQKELGAEPVLKFVIKFRLTVQKHEQKFKWLLVLINLLMYINIS